METYNLLIIDDDPNIRKLLNELLAGRSELTLFIAGDGKEAVKLFTENRIDIVLTDIHMPGFTGLELMADMKKINFKPEIMVMTANGTPENVETARKIGARSVILKPFDDLEVIEAEINRSLFAAKASRARRSGGGAAASAALPPAEPQIVAKKAAPSPAAAPARPKAPLWPAPSPAVPEKAPAKAAAQPPPAAAPEREETMEDQAWQGELTGNETPPAAAPKAPAAMPKPVAPAPPPAPAPKAPAPPATKAPAPPAAAPPAPPPAAPRTAPQAAARAAPQVAAAPPPAPPAPHPVEVPREAAAHPEANLPAGKEDVPDMPADLEAIFRTASSFDAGKLNMQVPIVCLQTWDEKGAIAALRRLAESLHREFYIWSASRGLVKDGGQAMGEMYRDANRALEFIRRQKNNGLYVLADFRPLLDDRTVVRALREMVMEMETARLMLVLTSPRLPAPPELSQACVSFDWPAGGSVDLDSMYQEVLAEVAASTGRVARLDRSSRDALLQRLKEMPAGRARFEIARALMAAGRTN